ncbi:chemocyanin-like [Herrania umbratica]|uniref:Chemocyanin-like n=1 Tax=Herrania umbratica TaxID=108875 RepID=A0A6J0ZLL8_9ROSI|nr:chemocyanin-like [Herrania umbratica]
MASRVSLVGLLIVALTLPEIANAAEYQVGDSFGLAFPPSTDFYANWASNKTFQAGDSVVFNRNGTHTATRVSKEDYDACNTTGGTILVTSGVDVRLDVNGTYYFICSVGTHCQQGIKVAFVVGDGEFDDLDRGSAPSLTVGGTISAILATLMICFFE